MSFGFPLGFTASVAVPAQPVLLLHMEGADASTVFTDHSQSGHVVTVYGAAQVDTAQSKFGSSALLMNAAGAYLALDGSSDFAFGTGDYTIDLWVRLSTLGAQNNLIDFRASTDSGPGIGLYTNTANLIKVYDGATGTDAITGPALSVNTWYHVALTRSGTTAKLFLNGTQAGSTWTDSYNHSAFPGAPRISSFEAPLYVRGHIDEVRIIKGYAAWLADFTAPSAAYTNPAAIVPSNTVVPAVTGTAEQGSTLTTTAGTWYGGPTPTFSYQWYRSPSTAIGSATASTYVLTATDVGNTIFCRVTATNSAGAVSADSNTTATIIAVITPVLLLHMNGTDGATSFPDSSASSHTVTPNSGAQVDTAQSKFGGASAYNPTGAAWLGLDGSSDFDFGTGDFTIDLWFRVASTAVRSILYINVSSGYMGPLLFVESNGYLYYYADTNPQIASTGTLSGNTWYHVAATRSGVITRLFLDGVQQGTYGSASNYATEAGHPMILSQGGAGGSECWVDELRVIKGTAVWTANFTPPTSAYT